MAKTIRRHCVVLWFDFVRETKHSNNNTYIVISKQFLISIYTLVMLSLLLKINNKITIIQYLYSIHVNDFKLVFNRRL